MCIANSAPSVKHFSAFIPQVIGFGSPSEGNKTSSPSRSVNRSDSQTEDEHRDELLRNVESRDLMNYGMIPEFVGRFPVTVSLSSLDKDALVDILTEPKDALLSQYKHLFDMDKVSSVPHPYTKAVWAGYPPGDNN